MVDDCGLSSLRITQDGLFSHLFLFWVFCARRLLGICRHLLPQAVDHIPAWTTIVSTEGQSPSQAALPGPVHCGIRPVAAGSLFPGKPAQEGEDMRIGQRAVRGKPAFSHAVGNALLRRPEYSVVIVGAGVGDIGKRCGTRTGRRGAGGPPQKGDSIGTSDRTVWREPVLPRTVSDTLCHRPFHCVGKVVACQHIVEGNCVACRNGIQAVLLRRASEVRNRSGPCHRCRNPQSQS